MSHVCPAARHCKGPQHAMSNFKLRDSHQEGRRHSQTLALPHIADKAKQSTPVTDQLLFACEIPTPDSKGSGAESSPGAFICPCCRPAMNSGGRAPLRCVRSKQRPTSL